MHLLFPSHVWRSSLCKPKWLTVSVSRSAVGLPFLLSFLNMIICVDLLAFFFIYAIGTRPHFIATTTKTKLVIQLLHAQLNPKEDLNAAHSSCLISRLLLEINK